MSDDTNGMGGWQPIETAPKDEWILACQSRNGIIKVVMGVDKYGNWKTGSGPMEHLAEVTHWMRLPNPPHLPTCNPKAP